ncbi:hypothetical protein U6A24_06495 [Aquimarina gracilis]|uniref:Sortilin (Neurotensin receptor 3) n=1 Tax=Aquimarina gracilis TaxID=874422 RepID=A0ABU5ZSP9_9FLAO|nr:hypothetical protein [Aquimarina gracilis]MEB3345101.1 hypothetical protein [Aquimarina gracilis]
MIRKWLTFVSTILTVVSVAQHETLQFKNIGPSRGGRVTAVCGVNDSISTFYMGATGGGLWKTKDSGNHWKNISDGYFSTPSIGAITVDQSNPNIIYVGTGSDAIRSNVIVGRGIYKSEDAGKTWSFSGLKEAGQIGAIEIHPENTNIIFAAVIGQPFRKSNERGVYKSTNGGKTWEQKLFLSDSVGAIDLKFAPGNSNIIYAAMWRVERKPWTIISGDTTGGVFKSTDAGENWEKMTKGLPQNLIGKIDFAVSPDKPERVWALIQAPIKDEGLYKSDNYGETWEHIKMPKKIHKSITYRPFYFTNLDVNPKNANQLWSGTKVFWTTKDAGKSWDSIPSYPHADHHDIWVNPNNPNVFIVGNDGGASVSLDAGKNWSTLFNQPTAELYTLELDDRYPYYLYSGQQDNSTIRVPSKRPREDVLSSNDAHGLGPIQYWESVGGCETGPVVPKPGDPNVVYANCKGQFGVYNAITGFQQNYYVGAESLYGNHPDDITYRFQRVVPIEVSPYDPNTVYYGSQYVHKTIDRGIHWERISPDLTANNPKFNIRSGGPIDEDISGEEYYNVLYAIEESPLEEGVIWTGSNDGLFYITNNGGKNWSNITPKNLPPGGRVSKVHASSHQKGKAYYTVNRDYLGDEKPYLYITNDYGKSWRLNVKGIPTDYPIRVVREDSEKEGLLFAGTEFGLFVSFDDGKNWDPFQQNLPIVPITDIKIFRDNLNIATLGRSFWIMEDISVLRQLELNTASESKLFTPENTLGENVNIYFSAEAKEQDSIHFTFKNEKDVIVHDKWVKLKDAPKNVFGVRSTKWDLKHYLKVSGEKDFSGPKVAPGKYSVSFTVGEHIYEEEFEFLLHPNLKKIGTSTSDLLEQEKLALKTAQFLIKVEDKVKKLKEAIQKTKKEEQRQILKLQLAKFIKGDQRYDQPKLLDHTKYLYKMITKSPQRPGEDAFIRYNKLLQFFTNK